MEEEKIYKISMQFFGGEQEEEEYVMPEELFDDGEEEMEGGGETALTGQGEMEGETQEQETGDVQTDGQQQEAQVEETGGEGLTPETTVTVELDGQPVTMTLAQLTQLAQKGKEYEGSEELAILDDFARESGMDRKQYMEELRRQRQGAGEEQAAAAMMAEGVPEQYARELAKRRGKEEEERKQRERDQARQKEQEPYRELLEAYPDMDKLPEPVLKEIAGGKRPLVAMQAYELAQLKAELEGLKQNDKNSKSAPGSLKNEGEQQQEDAFLAGLMGR